MWIKQILKNFVYRLRGQHTVESLVKRGLRVGKNFHALHGYDLDPSHCWLITIGDDVTLAPNVQIIAHDASTCHALGYAKIGRVTIGNRVFVGAGSIILPNVTIGDDVIIGAGSVVTDSVASGSLCAGNPARVICSTDDYLARQRTLINTRPVYSAAYTLRQDISQVQKAEQYAALADGIGFVE